MKIPHGIHLILIYSVSALISLLIGFTVYFMFTPEAVAEEYMPIKVTWTRPTERKSGAELHADEPLVYTIFCEYELNPGENWACATDIEATEYFHLVPPEHSGMAGESMVFQGIACDKYPIEDHGQLCSSYSNSVHKVIYPVMDDGYYPPQSVMLQPIQYVQ